MNNDVLYYSLSIEDELREKLDVFGFDDYKYNEKFHITLLYVGGKKDEKKKVGKDKVEEDQQVDKEKTQEQIIEDEKKQRLLEQNMEIMNEVVGEECLIEVDAYAISNSFITLSVDSIVFSKDSKQIPYYGNEFKHITIALRKQKEEVKQVDVENVEDVKDKKVNKSIKKKNKVRKLRPADSPSAFKDGNVVVLDEKILLKGKIEKVCKN